MGINLIFGGKSSIQLGDSKTYGMDEFDGSKLYNLNTLKEGNNWLKKIANIKKFIIIHFKKLYYKKIINILYLGPAWDDWSNFK